MMNRAQRWLIAWALVVIARVAFGHTGRLPPPAFSRWGSSVVAVVMLVAWWDGARQYRRLELTPERRRLVLRWWHVFSVLIIGLWLVWAVTGMPPPRWCGAVAVVGFTATMFAHAGGLTAPQVERWAKGYRVTVVVMVLWFLR